MTRLAIVASLVLLTLTSVLSAAEDRKPLKGYFTSDDGQTWFADDLTNIPPFEKDGRQCVRAFVFTVEGNTNIRFVGYLQRYTPEAKVVLERQQPGQPPSQEVVSALVNGTEVKRPGDKEWRKFGDAPEIVNIVAPGGKKVIPVVP